MTQIDSGNLKSRSYIETITQEMRMNDEEARFDAHLNREIEANAPSEEVETEEYTKVYLTEVELQRIVSALQRENLPNNGALIDLINASEPCTLDEFGVEV